ncbi:class I SAM-dependent DNA methyltransferase [Brevundimonas sp.]|uniref:class I SAM-dependent DNA methyltransferase n=1 Tax=Brevundimonas sp. TaxID=1871086 RepID=UPI002ED90074
MDADDFIRRWSEAPISERAHYQTFIAQLCRLIGVAAPDDERTGDLDYCFERPVKFLHEDGGSHPGYIDCYRRGAFVLEAKQSGKRGAGGALDPQPQLALFGGRGRKTTAGTSSTLETLMRNAKRQAENYAKALDEWPPFIVVVDVGRAIELWSDFGRQGKAYVPFPDRARYRIEMAHLRDDAVRERLRRVWSDPMSLDPAARVAEVTTDIAGRLAWLVRSIGGRVAISVDGRPDPVAKAARANQTALFVMQCIFAMFADSVGLIEDRGFRRFLESYRGQADQFHLGAGDFFRRMDEGGHCSAIRQTLRRFNGGLFRHIAALPITEDELEALIAAARRDWASVEPAIFGTLLEQALDPTERGELGAHYTPRSYVERLVEPTIMEPLRADWEAAEASAIGLFMAGDHRGARRMVREFHHELCHVRVLDPACGTGNFLYVAMGLMKELEGEVLAVLAEMGEAQASLALDGHTVSPEQFWGLEKNAYAAWIAEMVMWIGYLQWHFRVYGEAKPTEPILRNFKRIRQTDALLSWSREDLVRDAVGRPVTRARPRRKNGDAPVLFVADDDEREVVRLIDPRPTPWPDVHFIIGNPPFIGGKDLRRELGDGYIDALWQVRQGRFRSADLVTAWWDRAADILTQKGSSLRRFGFITTNSITQTFSRRVLEHHLKGEPPMRLTFAIPDHSWIKGGDRAAVRIAMTVAERGEPDGQGRLLSVVSEAGLHADAPEIVFSEERGAISADLSVNAPVSDAVPLKANSALAMRGVQLMGAGFIVPPDRAAVLLSASEPEAISPIRAYRNGRDLADRPRSVNVIDLFGWEEAEVRRRHPAIFQHVLETVKPDRDRNNRASYRDNWWIFGEPRRELRPALEGIGRYIATVETAKHRWFRFLDADILPDNKLVVIASDDAAILGVLSSRLHQQWFVANSARIGVYDGDAVYVKGACFDAFPFPDLSGRGRAEIAILADEIDDLRAQVLGRHDFLSMTGLYNARARWLEGGVLTETERAVHEAGCIGLLDHLHRRLDAAVLGAYGWPADLSAQAAVAGLVALNRERAIEEARGEVRFLRPDFQAGRVKISRRAVQVEATLDVATSLPSLPDAPGPMASALLHALRQEGVPVGPRALASRFSGRRGRRMEDRIEQTLAVLAVAGSVQRTQDGWFTPRRV